MNQERKKASIQYLLNFSETQLPKVEPTCAELTVVTPTLNITCIVCPTGVGLDEILPDELNELQNPHPFQPALWDPSA